MAIVLLVAAAVEFVPGGQNTAAAVEALIVLGFGLGLFLLLLRLYRQQRLTLYTLGDGRRALLYGSIGVLFVTVAARPRMWESGQGEFVFWVIVGLCIYALVAVARYARRY